MNIQRDFEPAVIVADEEDKGPQVRLVGLAGGKAFPTDLRVASNKKSGLISVEVDDQDPNLPRTSV